MLIALTSQLIPQMILDPRTTEWLNLLLRWTHVFAGIMWVGTTYYFTWLDARLTEEEKAVNANSKPAQIWMVHSGGFYVVEKRKVPDELSRKLHWFRWEAGITWISGFLLLVLMFYLGGGALVDPDVSSITVNKAILLCLGLLVAGGVVYDLLMLSPLGRNEVAFAGVAYGLIVAIAYGLTHVLSGRAAYIHMGAMLGTIMAANVWMHILPAQRTMIAAMRAGRQPDQKLAAQAKLRSKQNTFLAVPVVFLMISSHFAGVTYGEHNNWAIMAVLILLGWIAAKAIRRA